MYAYPVVLPQVSNREDFLTTVSIFDDNTGDPINLSGAVTASGLPFTGNNWMIITGAFVVNYTGTLTIPTPPIGNELSAVAIAFTPGLSITPGAPIKVVDPTGNNYLLGTVTSYAPTTGAMVVQFGSIFAFEVRNRLPRDDHGYVPYFYGPGTVQDSGPLLRATLGQGITIIDIGYLQILFPEAMFQKLYGGTYTASLVMSDGVSTRQVFLGTVPVISGSLSPSPFQVNAGAL
jgi:hypothetical protein